MNKAILILSVSLAAPVPAVAYEPLIFLPGPGGNPASDWVVLRSDLPDFWAGVGS